MSSSRVLRGETCRRIEPVRWEDAGSEPRSGTDAGEAQHPSRDSVDVDRAVREAYERGLAEGRTAGREQSAAEFRQVTERLGQTVASLHELRFQVRREAEGDLVKLSIAVARRVIHRELSIDPESIHALIKVALDKLHSREVTRVRVHPSLQDTVRDSLARYSPSRNIEISVDAALVPGDAIFETERGDLDACIDSQLREIERGFVDRLPK